MNTFCMIEAGVLPTLTRKLLDAQADQPSTRRNCIQLWSGLALNASTTSSLLRKSTGLKVVPGPSRTFSLPVTRYQFPVTSLGGGSLGSGGGAGGTSTRNLAEDQPVNPSLRRICLQVLSSFTPIDVTTSLNSRKPSDAKFVPGPSRTWSLLAVTRYLSPVGGGGGGGGAVILSRYVLELQPVNPSVRRRTRNHV